MVDSKVPPLTPLTPEEREIWSGYARLYKPKLGEPLWQEAIQRLLVEREALSLALKASVADALLLRGGRDYEAMRFARSLEDQKKIAAERDALAAEVERLRGQAAAWDTAMSAPSCRECGSIVGRPVEGGEPRCLNCGAGPKGDDNG